MAKVITDPKIVDEVLERGVENIYPDKKELRELLLSGQRIRLYCGYDPSSPSLQIGNFVSINKLAQFQELGHEVIFLVGDFTGMIGDPTDKLAVRKKLTREQVLENSKLYKEQASAFLKFDGDNPALIKYNSEWSDKITFKDLIEISSNFTVQQMIIRDMFQKRLQEEKPIYFHEFLYPVAQGYDSVAMDVDLEIGGNDQMFNMMCGRDLQKSINNKNKFVLTMKILADDKGKKMGKSEGNAIYISDTPENMYGIVMSWPDGVMPSGFELCTILPYDEVKKIISDLHNGIVNPRDAKMRLAFEITKIYHGEEVAKAAQDYFVRTVQNKELPEELEIIKLKVENIKIVDLLGEAGMVSSKSEARRLISEKAIKVDGSTIDNADEDINITKEGIILQRGKRQFKKILVD